MSQFDDIHLKYSQIIRHFIEKHVNEKNPSSDYDKMLEIDQAYKKLLRDYFHQAKLE